jgi:hypothetical protein
MEHSTSSNFQRIFNKVDFGGKFNSNKSNPSQSIIPYENYF